MDSKTTPLVLANRFLPESYKLALNITPSKPNFQGDLEIQLDRNVNYVEEDQDDKDFRLQLHCANIVIISASFESDEGVVEKLAVKMDRDLQMVTLSSPSLIFKDLAHLKVSMKYVGKISTIKTYQDTTAGVFKTNYLNGLTGKLDNYIISTHCQPKYARLIFPCVDELTSKPTFDLSIVTNIKYSCISNAQVGNVEIIDDVSKRVTFQKTPPMSPSIFGFVIGDLEYVEQKIKMKDHKEFPFRVYTPIGELENASYAVNVASLALPLIESMLKSKYPLEKLDFVALPFLSDSAMEDWGLIKIQQSYLLVPPDMIDQPEFTNVLSSVREVVVHEIVHQWIGNLITFDNWSHLWLNEAFATFTAYAVLLKLALTTRDTSIWLEKSATDTARMLENDSLHNANPIFVKHALEVKTTQDALNQEAYYKGISLLRMLANLFNEKSDDDFTIFFEIIGQFVDSIKFQSFKPVDLWNFMKESDLNVSKLDISTFMTAWTFLPGHPILLLSLTPEGKISITQHRYIYNYKVEEDESFEDVPYYTPVSCKLTDGTVVRQLFNGRCKNLEIEPDSILTINTNYCNLAKVQYCAKLYSNIATGISENKLTSLDLLAIASDLNLILGQPYQTDDDLIGLLQIAEAYLLKTTIIDFQSLDLILNVLQNLASAIQLINGDSNLKLINKLNKWISKLTVLLKDKLTWENLDYLKLSPEELKARNSILTLGSKYQPEEFQTIIKQLYKTLTHGPKNSILKEMLNSILCGTMSQSNQQKVYKEVLALAKEPSLIVNNVIRQGSTDAEIRGALQTSAILSLGYTSQPDLVLKTLNFVMTNIDSKLIELALIGLQDQPNLRKQLWDWYMLHFNTWCMKTLKEGSAYSQQMKATLKNTSKIIFAIMVNNVKNMKKVNAFIEEKMSSSLYKKFDLREIFDAVKVENEVKVKLGSHNEALMQWLNDH